MGGAITGGSRSAEDKQRLCPSCRMPMSVLAVRCRHCGTEVGRPKEEAQQFTIEDLGGETTAHYVPSNSVVEALQSFRMDNPAAQSDEGEGSDPGMGGIPDLDARSKALASLVMPTPITSGTIMQRTPESEWPRRLAIAGGILGACVLLMIVIVGVRAYIESRNQVPVVQYVNRAPGIMENGGPPLEALEAAADALRHDASAKNIEIAEWCWTEVSKQIDAFLAPPEWNPKNLQDAMRLAERAYRIPCTDSINAEMKAKVDLVRQEHSIYSFVLTDIDLKGSAATFKFPDDVRLNDLNPTGDGVTIQVGENEIMRDRFRLEALTANEVHLRDTKRKMIRNGVASDRHIICQVGEGPL